MIGDKQCTQAVQHHGSLPHDEGVGLDAPLTRLLSLQFVVVEAPQRVTQTQAEVLPAGRY